MMEPDDSPTDKEIEDAGRWFADSDEATKLAQELVALPALLDLLTTYGDGDAHERLDALRERFWANDKCQEATNQIIWNSRESDGEPA